MVAPTAPSSVGTPLRPWREVLASPWPLSRILPIAFGALAFAWIFADPIQGLTKAWWDDPDAGHGLLLFPVSLWLAWQAGLRQDTKGNIGLGSAILVSAVLLRALGGLAAEFFTQRFSIWMALVGLVVFVWGFRQVLHWWLPITLLALAIPLPATITNSMAVPLQFQASRLGAGLIAWRDIAVELNGNVITIPGQRLFVAEACSGLRSLTALISLGVLIGGMWLTTLPGRAMILLLAIPVAIIVNALRIFLTAFLMYFVSPEMGTGFMHKTEGWAMFVLALGMLALLAMMVRWVERRIVSRRSHA
jgi:exosortase